MLNKFLIILLLISTSSFSNAFNPIGNTDILPIYFTFEQTYNLNLNDNEKIHADIQLLNNSFSSSTFKTGYHLTRRIDIRTGLTLSHLKEPSQFEIQSNQIELNNNCFFSITNCSNLLITTPTNKIPFSIYVPYLYMQKAPLRFSFEGGFNYILPTQVKTNDSRVNLKSTGSSIFFNLSMQSSQMLSKTLSVTGAVGYESYNLKLNGSTNSTSNYYQELELSTLTYTISLIAQL